MNEKQWFINRIGKVVYRNKIKCSCKHCENGYVNGILIGDRSHAGYIYDINSHGRTKYFDTIKERDEYEIKLGKDNKHS